MPTTVLTEDFEIGALLNRIAGTTVLNKFGFKEAVGTSFEDIWDVPGDYTFLDTGVEAPLNIVSTSAADTLAGTGAQTIDIRGLNASYQEQEEIIELNGLTPVSTVLRYHRMDRMRVLTAGSGDANAGDISAVSQAAGTPLQGTILIGNNATFMGIYTIPRNKTGVFRRLTGSHGEANQTGQVKAVVKQPGSVFRVAKQFLIEVGLFNFEFVGALPQFTDLKIQAKAGNNPDIFSTDFDVLLIDNDELDF